RARGPGRPVDRTGGVRLAVMPGRPRSWLSPWSLLAGLVLTLLIAATINFVAFPGCAPAGTALADLPARCLGHARGTPAPFLITGRTWAQITVAAWSRTGRNGRWSPSQRCTRPSSLPDGITDLNHLRIRRHDRSGGVIHEYRLVA